MTAKKKKATRAEVEEARLRYEVEARNLKAHESQWDERWKAAKNPFEAIEDYRSKKFRAERKPVIDSWLTAKAAYDAIRPKTKKGDGDDE